MNRKPNIFKRVFRFYYEGFRNLSWWGKRLWVILILKAVVWFVVLKIFFFRDYLNENFDNDAQRSEHVLDELTQQNP